MVRVSSKEGVIWVQGQLTDNSWLLYPDVRLTGGFAYVIWFAGPHKGEFVLKTVATIVKDDQDKFHDKCSMK